MTDDLRRGGNLPENTTDTGRKLSEHLNPGMEDALNARYGHLLPGMDLLHKSYERFIS
jgi:4-carboxymuconolactone decarboxylase